ncbi:MAG: arginase [Phreatobacter sp.]|uniref:arginase n=1 Tax=Phreatobacter sp. TaxID=1966341 RepID=UPI001A490111|nr:arginase [Phreatobacter sp.]MBL8568456.1 arginase [Phreatobacter sp.]
MMQQYRQSPIVVIGIPVEEGAGTPGAAMGPRMLRTAGLLTALRDLGCAVEDWGDLALPSALPEPPAGLANAHNFPAIAGWSRLIARETHAVLASGRLPLVIGGDHALSMGSVSGVARHCAETGRPLFVLWLDAHADFNTPATSPSGNMHGMSAAMLTREPGLEAVMGDEPHGAVDPRNLTLFGIRSIDRAERDLLRARGIEVFDMRLVDEFGVAVLIRRVIERVAAAGGHLHVSLDVDFLDPALAPGVGTTVPGGATWREAHLIMELLHDSGLVGSLDVVELNPFLDERGKSALLLVDLVASLFGREVYARGP